MVVSSESGQVFVVDTTTFEQVGEPMTIGATSLMGVAVAPDGSTVAAVSRDGALRLWDLASRSPIAPALTAHDHGSTGVTYLSSGDLLSVGGDGTVVSWDVAPDDWRTRACELAGRNLSRNEWERFVSDSPYHGTCSLYATEN
jgi:WD40 repeat protein